MKSIILFVFSLTNFYTSAPFGDPLSSERMPILEAFSKYYVSLNFNAVVATEYRYENLYDSYNNTIGRQTVYEARSYHWLRPSFSFGFSYWKLKTFLYHGPIFDSKYLYEKVVYSSGYVPEETIRVERNGGLFESGIMTIYGYKGFGIGIGFNYLNRLSDSVNSNALNPVAAFHYISKRDGFLIQYAPPLKFRESDFELPNRVSASLFFSPSTRSAARVTLDLTYMDFSSIDSGYGDYFEGRFIVSQIFRDFSSLNIGGALEKSYRGNYYIPKLEFSLGYYLDPVVVNLGFVKSFVNYTENNYLIEENPLKVQLSLKIKK